MIATTVALISVNAYGEQTETDVTNEVIETVSECFNGKSASIPYTNIYSNCSFLGCERLQAKGSLKVDSLTSHEGLFYAWSVNDPITNEEHSGYASNLNMSFSFVAKSNSRKQVKSSGSSYKTVDHPWGSATTTGTIHTKLQANPGTMWLLELKYNLVTNSHSKADNFIKSSLAHKLEKPFAMCVMEASGLKSITINDKNYTL